MSTDVGEMLQIFPTEMLVEIFQYLSQTDTTESVQYVCKRWLDATKDSIVKKPKSLNLTTRPPPADILELIRSTHFLISSVALNDPIFELVSTDIWIELGKTVETIIFNRCTDLNEKHLVKILCHFCKLETLTFRFRFPSLSSNFNEICDNPIACKNLEKVKNLNITSNIWMDMTKVEQLVSRMPNLKHFGLWSLGITPVNDIMKVIKKQTKSIKSLSLRHCRTNDGSMLLEKLTNLVDLELEKFSFSISWISKNVVHDFFLKQNQIRVLQLSTSSAFPIEYFDCLKGLKNLKELSIEITKYQQNTFYILQRFLEIQPLRTLSFGLADSNPNFSCIGFHDIIPNVKLRHLRLEAFSVQCERCWKAIYMSLVNLESFSIPNTHLLPEQYSRIFEHMTNLRSLDLSDCKIINDCVILGYTVSASTQGKKQKTSDFTLKNLKGLSYLNLSNCQRITDDVFLEDYEMLDLRTLNVGRLKITLFGIEGICRNFRSLETLHIYGVEKLTAETLTIILQNLKRLKELDISKYFYSDSCQKFETDIYETLVEHGKKLRTLIALQRQILDTQILYLFQNMPNLVSVNDVTRTKLLGNFESNKKYEKCPTEGNLSIIDDIFLEMLEQSRQHNLDPKYMKDSMNLNYFSI